ncbi:MAG: patatin-like phospholipase family protein [Thermincolia bacterium]
MSKQPKVGLALGGGGARGLAHVGVLKVLVEERIPVDFIAGSSMGAIIGALFACGVEPVFMERLLPQLRQINWRDFTVPRMGLMSGNRVLEMFKIITGNKTFAQTKIPLAVVATDLTKGERVVINEGLLAEAMRASSAVPGVFQPVCCGEQVLVDGAVIDRVPIGVVREMGAEVIIAVDVRFGGYEPTIRSAIDVILRSIEVLEREITKCSILDADVLINPGLAHIGTGNFEAMEECFLIGEEAARQVLPLIREKLAR